MCKYRLRELNLPPWTMPQAMDRLKQTRADWQTLKQQGCPAWRAIAPVQASASVAASPRPFRHKILAIQVLPRPRQQTMHQPPRPRLGTKFAV